MPKKTAKSVVKKAVPKMAKKTAKTVGKKPAKKTAAIKAVKKKMAKKATNAIPQQAIQLPAIEAQGLQQAGEHQEYYRVLWLPELLSDWQNNPSPTSTHGFYPTEWNTHWTATQSENPDEYLLDVQIMGRGTRFHPRARTAFIKLAKEKSLDDFLENDLRRCGELAGTACCATRQKAYCYALHHLSPGLRIVTFRGIYVCDLQDGVCVQVVEKLMNMSFANFKATYHLNEGAEIAGG
jgi:hypothetical protein